MATKILLSLGEVKLEAELNDSETAKAIEKALPLEISLSRWGDEYYGSCAVAVEQFEDTRELMEIGELAYWPPGKAFCIFFGPTPASNDNRPRAASAVNPIGNLKGDVASLKELGPNIQVRIELVS